MRRPLRILHVITRMIVGGAQENTYLTVRDLPSVGPFEPILATGPAEGPEGDLLEAWGDPCPVVRIDDLVRPPHPRKDLCALIRLVRSIGDLRPDVVHTHSAKGGVLGRIAAARCGVPLVVHTAHGPPIFPHRPGWGDRFSLFAERAVAPHTDRWISVSTELADDLVRWGIADPDRIDAIESGMETDAYRPDPRARFSWRERLGIPERAMVVVQVARLFPGKGHADLLGAASICDPSLHFLLVGGGILREELARQAREHRLGGRLHFTGHLPPEEVPAALAAADLLVHASLREGLPRAVVQGLLCGLPAVAYRCCGVTETLAGGGGIVVEGGDRHALARGIAEAVSGIGALRERVRRRRPEIERRFGARRMAERIGALYLRHAGQIPVDSHRRD